MPESPRTVFIIDDDEAVRRGLARLLRLSGFSIETFESAESYLARTPYEGIGCLLVDLRMPGMDGLGLQRELNSSPMALPIIFLSAYGDIPTTVRTIKQGAVDFLTKPADEADLLHAIREAMKRREADCASELRAEAIRARMQKLTRREREVLRHVISGSMNKEIARELEIAEKTVKAHRGSVKQKLGTGSVAELVRMCAAIGLDPAPSTGPCVRASPALKNSAMKSPD